MWSLVVLVENIKISLIFNKYEIKNEKRISYINSI